MATMNVSLPDAMRSWIQDQLETGQYASSSDYIRDLIRRDQQRQERVRALQAAITEGLESGVGQEFDLQAFKKRMLESLDDAAL